MTECLKTEMFQSGQKLEQFIVGISCTLRFLSIICWPPPIKSKSHLWRLAPPEIRKRPNPHLNRRRPKCPGPPHHTGGGPNYAMIQWKTSTIWSGPTDCPYKLKTIFWTKFLTPERPQFCGQFQITSIVIKNHWMKSECVTSDKLYQSMSSYESKTKFWTKFGPKKP